MENVKYVLSTEYGGTYFKELYPTTLTLTHDSEYARTYDSVDYAYEQRDEILARIGIKFNVTRITTKREIVDIEDNVIIS